MESVLDGFKEASEETGILFQVIACNMRHLDEETNIRMMRECREFLGEGLCAIDLAGDEKSMPNAMFGNLFAEAKKLDYPYTIHAGECGSVQSILDAVEMGAKRIGHGIAMMGNAEVQKLVASKRIGVEMCPISNYQTKALQPEQVYPIRDFAKMGVLTTINTDNRTVSNTCITKEMEFLNKKIGISEDELYQYQMNAVDVAFCDDAMKHEIWKSLK
jgi:adenosine deaminase